MKSYSESSFLRKECYEFIVNITKELVTNLTQDKSVGIAHFSYLARKLYGSNYN